MTDEETLHHFLSLKHDFIDYTVFQLTLYLRGAKFML